MKKENWIWMPHPAHFICARDCKFHLATVVGAYIVSTVGELEPCMEIREISAQSRGIKLQGRGDERRYDALKKLGWETLGAERTYETMVFKCHPTQNKKSAECCPYRIDVSSEVDMEGYNSAGEAYLGHMKLCEKWAKKK